MKTQVLLAAADAACQESSWPVVAILGLFLAAFAFLIWRVTR